MAAVATRKGGVLGIERNIDKFSAPQSAGQAGKEKGTLIEGNKN